MRKGILGRMMGKEEEEDRGEEEKKRVGEEERRRKEIEDWERKNRLGKKRSEEE